MNIARQYKTSYGVDLSVELDKKIIGSLGSLLAGACQHKVISEVHYLFKAGKSNRKYETLRKKDTAIEVFCEVCFCFFCYVGPIERAEGIFAIDFFLVLCMSGINQPFFLLFGY